MALKVFVVPGSCTWLFHYEKSTLLKGLVSYTLATALTLELHARLPVQACHYTVGGN